MSIRNPYSGRMVSRNGTTGLKVLELERSIPQFVKSWDYKELHQRFKHIGEEGFTPEVIKSDILYARMVYFLKLINTFNNKQVDEIQEAMKNLSL
jgi:D-mannonate dehydratase